VFYRRIWSIVGKYSILCCDMRNEALQMGEPPSLRFIFETSERIEINLLEEKAAMGFLKREEKPPEMAKVAKCRNTG
jgi:hypothetical protein